MNAEIYTDVRSAFLDLQATEAELTAATRGRELANQQLTQSRDRFAAGVAEQCRSGAGAGGGDHGGRAVHRGAVRLQRGQGAARTLARYSAKDAVQKYLGGLQ